MGDTQAFSRRPKPWRTVAFKLSALTSFFVLGVIAAMAALLFKQAEAGLVAEMTVRAEFFARSVREAIVPKLDPFQLHFQVEQASREKAVKYAAVLDADGRVISHSDPARIGERPDDPGSKRALAASRPMLQRSNEADGGVLYDLAAPVTLGARKVGTVRLGFDRSSLAVALAATRRRTALVAAISIAAAVLGTVLIVGWIMRPLPRLADAVDQAARGRFGLQVETRSRDEIGLLARAFNEMSIANQLLFTSLREEKEKIETMFRDAVEGMVWVDPAGGLRLVNPSARRLLGLEGLPVRSLAEACSEFKSDPPLDALLGGSRRIVPFEWTRQKPKLLILSGVCDRLEGAGASSGFLFMFREATLEKRGETLARDFLSIVSHKLRTPLAVVLGYLELLKDDESLGKFQREAVAKMRREQDELRRQVEKLLTFTVVQSPEKIALQRMPVPTRELVDTALKRAGLPAEGVVVEMDEKALSAAPAVDADPMLAREALAAYLENAVKFNTGKRKMVRLDARRNGGQLVLSVFDDGPGIPSEEHHKLFRKFYQIDDDFTGQVPGMGLGLAFVRAVAQAHGGTAGMESIPGKGSQFWLSLPVAADAK